MDVPVWYWVAFATFVTVMLTLDLFVFHKQSHDPTLRESAWWTAFWCGLALAFNGWIWYVGQQHPEYFPTEIVESVDAAGNTIIKSQAHWSFLVGYLVEWALSVDNVFVFAVVFGHFRVPLKYQYRVLFWGILGAILMRLVFVIAGSKLLQYAEWMLPVFGIFLIYTAVKLAFKKDEEVDPENNLLMRLGRKIFNVSKESHGDKFFVRENGLLCATPLFMVLLVIESTDVLFAVDSVPAILGITKDTFIVFTSNIFAIMGLRALYFLLAGVMDMFKYLNYGLSAILGFVGIKMIGEYVWMHVLHHKTKLLGSPFISLGVIVGILVISIGASILVKGKSHSHTKQDDLAASPDEHPPVNV